jgi:hypothetical protein
LARVLYHQDSQAEAARVLTDEVKWVVDVHSELRMEPLLDGEGFPQHVGPRWSPDGCYIAAMTLDQHRLMVFDRNTAKWSPIAEGIIHNPVCSQDGKHLYFQALQEDEVPIFRISVTDRHLERICDRECVEFRG